MSITEQLLRPLLASSAARPLITHYDDVEGTRVELSVATMANWAAKTANWLVEQVDIEPGDQVAVALPAHWQTASVLLGAWWCGAEIVNDTEEARIAFVRPGEASSSATATAVVALDPLGRGLSEAPDSGALDYLAEAKLAGDEFSPLFPIPGDTLALCGSAGDDVLIEARTRAERQQISINDRVLSTMEWSIPEGVLAGLLTPLAAGAHLVQVSHTDNTTLADHRQTERVTVDLSS